MAIKKPPVSPSATAIKRGRPHGSVGSAPRLGRLHLRLSASDVAIAERLGTDAATGKVNVSEGIRRALAMAAG